jgi:pimeloyl-ACP methyl ester carboxylesterase
LQISSWRKLALYSFLRFEIPNLKFSNLSYALGIWIVLTLSGCTASLPAVVSRQSIEPRRVGEVFVFRGFMGIWSRGMDQLTTRLRADGIVTSIFGYNRWADVADELIAAREQTGSRAPVVLIGHSYGADDVLRLAQKLQRSNVRVDLVVTVECVTPPPIPVNVRQAVNIYKPRDVGFSAVVARRCGASGGPEGNDPGAKSTSTPPGRTSTGRIWAIQISIRIRKCWH